MKKKIIFVAVCAVLLLILASSSYGELDPKYKTRAHPWGHMESPSLPRNQDLDVLLVVISPYWVLLLNHPYLSNHPNHHKIESIRLPQFDSSIKLNQGTNEKSIAR